MYIITGILSLIWKLHVAVVFGISTVIFYPLIYPFLFTDKGKRKSFYLFVLWSWTMRVFCLYHVKKKTKSSLPAPPYIIVANHSSYLDIFLTPSIMSQTPFLYLGKSEILNYPLLKTYFKKLHIPIHRGSGIRAARALVSASREVEKGWSLMVFPEGGIPDSHHPKMIEFKEGAFNLAKSLKVPIVPITFSNNYKLFSDPTQILGPASPGISKVHIHPFISKEEVARSSQNELKKMCYEIINEPILKMNPDLKE